MTSTRPVEEQPIASLAGMALHGTRSETESTVQLLGQLFPWHLGQVGHFTSVVRSALQATRLQPILRVWDGTVWYPLSIRKRYQRKRQSAPL